MSRFYNQFKSVNGHYRYIQNKFDLVSFLNYNQWTKKCSTLLVARRNIFTLSSNLFESNGLVNRSGPFLQTSHTTEHHMLSLIRPLSLKVKNLPDSKNEFPNDIVKPTVILYDEERFRRLSKEFVDNLSKNQLKNVDNIWKDVPPSNLVKTLDHYAKLSKIKLTGLIVLTTMAGFYMAVPSTMDYSLLAWTLMGTSLTSGSAASWNHFLEVPFDSQMKRTQDRPLVQRAISPLHAATFALVSGTVGITILATCVNPLTAILGGLNLCLYSFIYTPMKRVHIANTWIGAVVGAIPPVMGFTAVNNAIDLPSILLGLILYSWQFPHFNALSWNMRHEYARAGYRMMSVTNPKLCQNTALRHSTLLLACTTAMCTTGVTHWSFGIDTLPFSLYLVYLSYQFKSDPTSKTSRKLFLYSLIYLPVIMFLMAISKNRNKKQGSSKPETEKPILMS